MFADGGTFMLIFVLSLLGFGFLGMIVCGIGYWGNENDISYHLRFNRRRRRNKRKRKKEAKQKAQEIKKEKKRKELEQMELSNLNYDIGIKILQTLERKGVIPSYKAKLKQCVISIDLEPNQGQKSAEIKLFLNAFDKVNEYLEAAIYKQVQTGKIIPVDNEKNFISPKKGIFKLTRSGAKQILLLIYPNKSTFDFLENQFNEFFNNDNLNPMSFVAFLSFYVNEKTRDVYDALKDITSDQVEIYSFKIFGKEIFKIND